MQEFGYTSPIYGHFGEGCVHTRLTFDMASAQGVLNFRQFIDRAADITLAHGGSLSGEHGDGQARAALLPKMFGPELIEAFREFKKLWDPDNRMNPGKLSDAVRVYDPTENLRHSPSTGENLGAPGTGSPATGPRRWGGDPSHLGTGDQHSPPPDHLHRTPRSRAAAL